METAELSSIRVSITSSITIWTHEPAALLLSLNHPVPGCWKILKLLPTQRHTSKTLRVGWRNKAGEMNSLLQDLLAQLGLTPNTGVRSSCMRRRFKRQNVTRFRDLGGEPPPVDLIVWFWKGRPAPQL